MPWIYCSGCPPTLTIHWSWHLLTVLSAILPSLFSTCRLESTAYHYDHSLDSYSAAHIIYFAHKTAQWIPSLGIVRQHCAGIKTLTLVEWTHLKPWPRASGGPLLWPSNPPAVPQPRDSPTSSKKNFTLSSLCSKCHMATTAIPPLSFLLHQGDPRKGILRCSASRLHITHHCSR